jgi:hypothetical protein
MQPAKRRRLEQSTTGLSKPFRSPLRKAINEQPPQERLCASKSNPHHEGVLRPPDAISSSGVHEPDNVTFTSPEPELYQKQHTLLTQRLKRLRQSLDIAQQALEIEDSGRLEELAQLITKWRVIAQEAADEVFADAENKVADMGGVRAWKHRAEEDSLRWNHDREQHVNPRNLNAQADDGIEQGESDQTKDEYEEDVSWRSRATPILCPLIAIS